MYEKYVSSVKDPNFFENEPSIHHFVHWRIIKNQFPYDVIAKTHHMLIPMRQISSEAELNEIEKAELKMIKKTKIEKDYDAILLQHPRNQSVSHWLHYHLLVFKTVGTIK